MKLRLFIFILPVLGLLTLVRGEPEFLKDFPPLVLTGQSKEAAESFKSSSATQELYNKYYGFARMLKTGDLAVQKKLIKSHLDKDLPYWKIEAAREFNPPNPPKTKDKKILKTYEERTEKAAALHAKKIAVAEAYVNWLGTELPAWVNKIE